VCNPITRVPGVFLNKATTDVAVLRPWRESCYTHVGVELPLDDLSSVSDLAAVDDLDTYIVLPGPSTRACKQCDGTGPPKFWGPQIGRDAIARGV
jgi:hypothetical protein